MTGPDNDADRFDAALRLCGLTQRQLWLQYMALGGTADVFDMEAFLQGLGTLEPFQRDVLAHAVNERLQEVLESVRLPYLDPGPVLTESGEDPLQVLAELHDPHDEPDSYENGNPH